MGIFLELHANWYFSFLNQRLNIPEETLQKPRIWSLSKRQDATTQLIIIPHWCKVRAFNSPWIFGSNSRCCSFPLPQLPFPWIVLCYLWNFINLRLATYGIKNILHQSKFISLYSSAKTHGWIIMMERVRGEHYSTLGCITELHHGYVLSATEIQGLFWTLLVARCNETSSRNHLRILCSWEYFLLRYDTEIKDHCFPRQNSIAKLLRNYFKNTKAINTLSNRYFYISSCVRNQDFYLCHYACWTITTEVKKLFTSGNVLPIHAGCRVTTASVNSR